MRRTLTAIALISAAALPAQADDSRLVYSVKTPDIEAMLTEEGYTILNTGGDGPVSVRARTEDGLIFNMIGTACETDHTDGCLGLNMQVRYTTDTQDRLFRINNANLMWSAVSIWYTQTGFDGETPTVGISRYVILDNGVTAANIKDNLYNLLAIAPQAANYVWERGPYAPGGEEDEEDDWDDDWEDW